MGVGVAVDEPGYLNILDVSNLYNSTEGPRAVPAWHVTKALEFAAWAGYWYQDWP